MRAMVAALVVWGGAVWAEDRALILANENYRDAADVDGAADLLGTAGVLTANGFRVAVAGDATSATMRARLSELLAATAPGDRVVIAIAGHFAHSGSQSFALGTEASLPDLEQAGAVGVDLGTVLYIAGLILTDITYTLVDPRVRLE